MLAPLIPSSSHPVMDNLIVGGEYYLLNLWSHSGEHARAQYCSGVHMTRGGPEGTGAG